MADFGVTGEVVVTSEKAEAAFDRVGDKATQMANEVASAAGKAGQAVDGVGTGAEKSADKFTRAESLMRAAIMKSTRELELLGKTASQRFEAQIDFKGLEKAKFQEAISGLQAMESALSVAKAREAEFAAQNGFSLKAAQAKELVKASEYARWWAQELEKVEAAEKRLAGQNSFINSLKSQADAIGKTKADLLEMQAAQMGVATQAAPFIAKMREAEAGIGKMGVSAAQTAAALRGVPAQFTDIITSLQGGQAPLTVFLQQGGQLKDMFGGAGNAARALGGYVLGLVNPFTIAAAAAGALAFAYNQGSKEADAYRMAMVGTGNAAGTTAGQLKSYAQEISGVIGTQGKAAESLAAFVSTGRVSRDVLKEASQAAIAWERATGQAVGATAKQFADLGKDPLQAVLKLNEGTNFLTESVYRQIKSLDEQGRTAEAAAVAQRAYADALTGRAGEIERNLGSIETAWNKVKDAAKGGWDAILNVGRAETNQDKLTATRKQIADLENRLASGGGFGSTAGGAATGRPDAANNARLQAQLRGLQAQAAALEGVAFAAKTAAEAEAERAKQMQAAAAWDKEGAKYLTDKAKLERDLTVARNEGLAAGKSQAEIEKRLAQIRDSYAKKGGSGGIAAENKDLRDQQRIFAELADVSSTYYADLEKAQQQRAKGNLSEAQYVKYVEELIQKQPFAVAQEKARAEAIKESAKAAAESSKALSAWAEVRAKESQGLQTQINARREEVTLMGMTAEAVAAYTQAKYEQQAAEKEAYAAALESASFYAGEYAEAYNIAAEAARNQAKQLRELGGLEVEKVNKEAAKKAADEWQRAADDINRSLTDALMRGFESGKDFAQNLRDTVINMFNTMVLRPVISVIVNPVAGAVTSALGLSGAQGGSNSIMGGIQTASNLNSLYGAGSQALFGGAAGASAASLGYANIVGMAGGDAIGALAAANGMWAGVATGAQAAAQAAIASNAAMAAGTAAALPAGTTAAAAGAGAGGASGALAAIPGWGWAAAAGVAVLGSVLSRKTEKRGSGLMGTLGEEDGVHDLDLMRKGGSLLSGPKWFVRDMGVSGMDDALQETYKAQRDALMQMGDALGLATARVENFTVQLGTDTLGDQKVRGIRLDGLSDQEAQAKIAEALATANNEIAQQIIGSWERTTSEAGRGMFGGRRTVEELRYIPSEFARDGEEAIDTLTRLATSLMGVNSVFENLGYTLYEASLAGGDMASQLVDMFGSRDAFNQATGAFFQNFYSVEDQRAAAQRGLQAQLDTLDMGLVLPDIDVSDARDQFRALAEAQDRSTEEGQKAWAMLIQLSGAFAGVTQSVDDAREAARQLAEEQARAAKAAQDAAYDNLRRAIDRDRSILQDQASMLSDTIGSIADAVSMLKTNARELYGTVDSTAQMLAAQGMVYVEQALAGVQAGGSVLDYTGLEGAISAARTGVSSGVYASQFERERDALVLAGQLSQLGDLSDLQLSVEERQLQAINDQLDYLDSLNERAQALVDGTAALTESVDTYMQRLLKLLEPAEATTGTTTTPVSGEGVFSSGPSGGGSSGSYSAVSEIKDFYNQTLDPDTLRLQMWLRGWTVEDMAQAADVTTDFALDYLKLPKFAVGTNYVTRDMPAIVHEGEAIVPKAFNPWANGGGSMGGGNSELIAEVRSLRQEVAALRASGQAIAENTSGTPQLVRQFDQVTQGGNAIRNKALA